MSLSTNLCNLLGNLFICSKEYLAMAMVGNILPVFMETLRARMKVQSEEKMVMYMFHLLIHGTDFNTLSTE